MKKKAQTIKNLWQNFFFEEPALNNLNHVYELYKESGSDNKKIEEIAKGEKKKNVKQSRYTNMDEDKKETKLTY